MRAKLILRDLVTQPFLLKVSSSHIGLIALPATVRQKKIPDDILQAGIPLKTE
jgi:hypothetical protein